MRAFLLFACLAAVPALAAAQAPLADPNGDAMAAACGGDIDNEAMMAMPKAARHAKLSCFVREGATRFSQQLPRKLDETTTLEKVSADGTRLTYHYQIGVAAADVPAAALDGLKANVRTSVCNEADMRAILGLGGSYRYLWVDSARKPLAELVLTGC